MLAWLIFKNKQSKISAHIYIFFSNGRINIVAAHVDDPFWTVYASANV